MNYINSPSSLVIGK